MINSDCHHKDYIEHGFEDAAKLAKACGFSSVKKITGQAQGPAGINIVNINLL